MYSSVSVIDVLLPFITVTHFLAANSRTFIKTCNAYSVQNVKNKILLHVCDTCFALLWVGSIWYGLGRVRSRNLDPRLSLNRVRLIKQALSHALTFCFPLNYLSATVMSPVCQCRVCHCLVWHCHDLHLYAVWFRALLSFPFPVCNLWHFQRSLRH